MAIFSIEFDYRKSMTGFESEYFICCYPYVQCINEVNNEDNNNEDINNINGE